METKRKSISDFDAFDKKAKTAPRPTKYVLRLYVTGNSQRSTDAIRTITSICKKHLSGHYELEIVNLYRNPALAKRDQIVASPTLIRKLPLPLLRFIGNLADRDKVLVRMDLIERKGAPRGEKELTGVNHP
jgi:circadian clock protein KaiB